MDIRRILSNLVFLLSQHRVWAMIAIVCCLLCAFIRYFKVDVMNGIFWLVALLVNITFLKNNRQ